VDQFNIRSDYRTNRSTIFGRFSYEDADTFNPGNLPEPAIGAGPGRPGQVVVPSKQAVLGYGRSLGPSRYYDLRVGYSRMFQGIYDSGTKYGSIAEQLGILNANSGGAAPGLSTTNITGMTGLGDGAGSLQKVNNNWEIDQAFSWVRNRHELKFGFDYMSRRFAFYSPGSPSGSFTFSGIYSGFGLADFLFGRPINSRFDATKFFSLQRFYFSWFVQDNWRVNSRLSVNVGLRNDSITAWKERHNRLAAFVPEGGGNLIPVGTAPFTGDSVQAGRPWQLGPRLGLSYTITPKTVLRTGGGIFYSFKTVTSGNSLAKNAPFSGTLLTTNDAANFAAAKPISAGFPADRPQLWPITGTGFYYWPQDAKTSTMYEWNINLQRELVSNLVLSVVYVGGKGTYVDVVGLNINQAIPGPGAVVTPSLSNLGDAAGVVPWETPSAIPYKSDVRAADGRGTIFRRVDVGSQHRRYERRSRATARFRTRSIWPSALLAPPSTMLHKLAISSTVELPFSRSRALAQGSARPVQLLAGGWQLNAIGTFQTGLAVHADDADQQPEYRYGITVPECIASGTALWNAHYRPLVRRFPALVAPARTCLAMQDEYFGIWPGHEASGRSLFKNSSCSPKAAGSNSARKHSTF
jgi:hypothetical protein